MNAKGRGVSGPGAATPIEPAYGWAFVWTKNAAGGLGFVCGHTFRLTRREAMDHIIKVWQREDETSKSAWRRIRKHGGRVIRAKVCPFGVNR